MAKLVNFNSSLMELKTHVLGHNVYSPDQPPATSILPLRARTHPFGFCTFLLSEMRFGMFRKLQVCVYPTALTGQGQKGPWRPGHCSNCISYDLIYSIVKTQLGKSLGVQRAKQIKKVMLFRINIFLSRKCVFYNYFGSSGSISFIEGSLIYFGQSLE